MQGRVTRDDIRSAGLRRWDGRGRVTTDWVNIFHVCRPFYNLFAPTHITSRSLSYAGQAEIVTSICANLASPAADLPFEFILPFSESEASPRWWIVAS